MKNVFIELKPQIYISDDSFLAVAATVQSVVNGVGRIAWGFIFDYLGYRKTMLCITSGTTIFTLTFVCLPFLESNATGAKVMSFSEIMVVLVISVLT